MSRVARILKNSSPRPAAGGAAGPSDNTPAASKAQANAFRQMPDSAREKLREIQNGAASSVEAGAGTRARAVTGPGEPTPEAGPTAGDARNPIREPAREPAGAPRAHGSEIVAALESCKPALVATAVFSLVINMLMLTGPVFMLQVYDRVLTSGSVPTLVVLTILAIVLYGAIAALELVRSRVVVRVGHEIDQRLSGRVFEASIRHSLKQGASSNEMRDLDQIRQFLSGPGPITLVDAPWAPIYLVVIFLLHWTLGVAAAIGAVLLVALAWVSETSSRGALSKAGSTTQRSLELAEDGHRNGEALTAMGMMGDFRRRWQVSHAQALDWQLLAADRLGAASSISKSLRLLLQSMMLAAGAALALGDLISAGTIVAATIIFGRAMAPVEQAIGHWRAFSRARESYLNLEALLAKEPPTAARTALPEPMGHVAVSGLAVTPPGARQPVLGNVNFKIGPGDVLAVIGPSATGKSSLVRALVGVWEVPRGSIRLDGAPLDQWDSEQIGKRIGFLPQNVEIFSGTVRENIARFRSDAQDDEVVQAAKHACCHELILRLPNGYDTAIGAGGLHLSAGQRQRIGLARALFRDPVLVVLDEPNANLDREGDEALTRAIQGMRERKRAVVIVSHRVQAIQLADYLLYLDRGVQQAFGPRDAVMQRFQGKAAQGPQRRASDVARSGPAFDAGEKL